MPRVRPSEIAFLVLSLGLHLIALGVFGPRQPPFPVTPTLAPLQWVDLAPVLEARPPSARARRLPPSPPRRREAKPSEPIAAMPEPVETPPVATLAPTSTPTPEPSRSPGLPLADLLASARAIGRETARIERGPSQDAGAVEDRPILPQLDRALRRAAASERNLGNGMTRIVTAGGRIYCLQAPPDFARGGPAEMLAVPTNCP